MSDPSLQTVPVESDRLDAAIKVLAGAASSFRLSDRERAAYRALMLSANLAIASLALELLLVGFTVDRAALQDGHLQFLRDDRGLVEALRLVVGVGFAASGLAGLVAFALNVPLWVRMFHERARLRSLGVNALTRTLWKAGRRTRWTGTVHRVLIGVFAALNLLLAVGAAAEQLKGAAAYVALFLAVAALLLGAWNLRNQREQLELAADAGELEKALDQIRLRSPDAATVEVPEALIERAAMVESAQIARDRMEALLRGTDPRRDGLAISFERQALSQRAALPVPDRLELEDVLASLSTRSPAPGVAPGAEAGSGVARYHTASGGEVQVEYTIDPQASVVRVSRVTSERTEPGRAEVSEGANHV